MIYHRDKGSGGNMLITEVGNDFSRRNHLGVLHSPLSGAPDNGRRAAASFGNDGGVEYMFYEAGERLSGAIAVAKAVQQHPATALCGARPLWATSGHGP